MTLDTSSPAISGSGRCPSNRGNSRQTLDKYAEHRDAHGVAPATIHNELAILRRIFSIAIEKGLLVRAPRFPVLRADNARRGYFERDDLNALLEELPDYMQNLAEFAYHTGWRMRSELIGKKDWTSELFPLTWSQVDFAAGEVRIGDSKNKRGRTFPFKALPDLEACLLRQRAYTDEWERRKGKIIPYVFHRGGTQMRDFPYSAWRGACERAGIPEKIGHDFRRTAVRNLERAGVPRSVAMQLTGHKTESVYRRYDIVSQSDLTDGVAKLAKYGDQIEEERRKVLQMRRRA